MYDGPNPVIRNLVDRVNAYNKVGKILNVKVYCSNRVVTIFDKGMQSVNITAYEAEASAPTKSFRDVSRSPKPKRPKGAPSFHTLKKQGVIVCTEYYRQDVRHRLSFKPLTTSESVRWEVPDGTASVYFAETGVTHFYGHYYDRDGDRFTGPPRTGEHTIDGDVAGLGVYILETKRTRNSNYIPGTGVIKLHIPKNLTLPENPTLPTVSHLDLKEQPAALANAMAQLNSGAMDALTAIAEMRSTIEGLMSNVVRTLKWVADVRGRGLLTAKVKIAESDLRFLLESRYQGKFINERSLRAYRRDKRKAEKALARRDEKLTRKYGLSKDGFSPSALTDRFAGHWLDSIYGIGATALTTVELLELLDNQKAIYVRGNSKFSYDVSMPEESGGWKLLSSSVKVNGKAFAKGQIDVGLLSDVRRYTTLNPLLTAWETTPLSFVVDWFVEIGNLLASLDSGGPNWKQRVLMYLYKTDINYTYALQTDSGTFYYEVTGFRFDRVYATPDSQLAAFYQLPDFSGIYGHLVTAFSLAWLGARRKLTRTITNG